MTTRRDFLKQATGLSLSAVLPPHILSSQEWNECAGMEAIPPHSPAGAAGLFFGRYEGVDRDRVFQRMLHETKILCRLGLAEDLQAAAELAQFAREEGIHFRLKASGCSSILPYLLGFSDVDPLRHRLYFERFRDPDARWAPPFVIEIDGQHRERIRHLANLGYGKDFIKRTIQFLPTMSLQRIPLLASKSIRHERDPAWQLDTIPTRDETTFHLICRGDTEGLCVLHRGPLRDLLPRLQPRSIEDLAAALTVHCLSVEREDLMDEYLARAENPAFPGAENPDILETLGETRGLILYQEQIMMLLDRLGGIAPADGYEFVKAACKRKANAVAECQAGFLSGAIGRGIQPEAAGRLFEEVTRAAGYAFCKANYVAKAMAVYQTAYLKAHHRSEFERAWKAVRAGA